jgi:hypothetical protein
MEEREVSCELVCIEKQQHSLAERMLVGKEEEESLRRRTTSARVLRERPVEKTMRRNSSNSLSLANGWDRTGRRADSHSPRMSTVECPPNAGFPAPGRF